MLGRRYTRNPESPPLWIDIPIFFFLPWTELVKFLLKIFELFSYFPFLLISVLNMVFPSYMYILFPFSLFFGLRGLSPKGGALS